MQKKIVAATTTYDVELFNKKLVTNAVKYAKRPPMSSAVKIAALVFGVPTFGLGALLVLGIHRFSRLFEAGETKSVTQKEQAEMAYKTITADVSRNPGDQKFIQISLGENKRVTCTERGDGLWIQVTKKTGDQWVEEEEEEKHPKITTIEGLQQFFKDDITNNFNYYLKKNPTDSFFQGLETQVNPMRNNIRNLLDLMDEEMDNVDRG